MNTYAIYNESTEGVLTLYYGINPSTVTPFVFVLISPEDYEMAISNLETLK